MSNIITVTFGNNTSVTLPAVHQYDTDIVISFADITLPETYEVHFANHREVGCAVVQIGTGEGVAVPDQLLKRGRPVFCWLYVGGKTTHEITIPVIRRPAIAEADTSDAEASAISTLISQMQSTLEEVRGHAETVSGLVSQAQSIVDEAEGLTATVDNDGYIVIGKET